MIVRRAAVTAGMAVAAMGLAAGVSHAGPAAAPAPVAPAPTMTAPAVLPLPFHDVASREENDRAFGQFGAQVGIAVTVGSLVGTIAGAGIGCIATLPAGCVPGLVTGAGIGGVVGTIVAGGPTLGVSAYQLWETYNAAPGTSIYADRDE
ncbi:hypothetical protein I1A62_37580 [Rhodococcus sp. USK10]|uniref:hypothetical protein n=1 Tax=Rhodococcus sp. USK10 TaxID=2789739 RepID=UPI001C5E1FEE|nr:hypothetical protein [Rhodococcus sp. USK10]QYB02834.1 hypothetical protein I1A62_37580 [Rhodococcus sp. USK10]